MENKPKVITLCGSTKFKNEFLKVMKDLTLHGKIVIPVGVFGHAESIDLSEEQKNNLDKMHFAKIDMSDEIFVIDVNGYVGHSTKNEIEYANKNGKRVRYYSKVYESSKLKPVGVNSTQISPKQERA